MTAPLDLDALEAMARAATPGPWRSELAIAEHDGLPAVYQIGTEQDAVCTTQFCYAPGSYANAAHIATFDPPTVLALIARLRAAEAREREAWIAGRDAAAKRVRRFQDVVGWQTGESRNEMIGDIERAIRALTPPERADD